MAIHTAETNGAVPHDSQGMEAGFSTPPKLSSVLEKGQAFTKALGGSLVILGKHIGGNGISHVAETGKHAAHMVSDLAHNRNTLSRAGWIGAKVGRVGGLLLLAENPLAFLAMAVEAGEEGHGLFKAVRSYRQRTADNTVNNKDEEPSIDFYREPKPGEQEIAAEFAQKPAVQFPVPAHIDLHERLNLHRGGKKHRQVAHIRVT